MCLVAQNRKLKINFINDSSFLTISGVDDTSAADGTEKIKPHLMN